MPKAGKPVAGVGRLEWGAKQFNIVGSWCRLKRKEDFMKFNIRLLYLYLFSFVGLLITIIGSVSLVDLGFKTYVFRVTERVYCPEPRMEGEVQLSVDELEVRNKKEESNQRKRQVSNSLAMMVVGVPVYWYHWKTIKKEK